MRPLKKYNFPEALQKLRKYCAYQERCHQEVRKKLAEWGFDNEDKDKIIVQLMEEGFLNEERYAKAIVRGKLRQKGLTLR
ncbi:MAG: RecX family transcriptional regulator [Bacteroidetes bacterium]|nr:RecX family transcriptional regulator [Bacteroidota bacterium]